MAKYSFFLTLLSCLIFGSCQTIEQISIDYMMPAEINFPPELRRVAIVNNVSAIPDNKWIEAEKPISGNEVARAIAYTHGDAGIATESLARAIADGNYFDEVVICDSALRADDKIAREEALSQEEVGELTDKLDVDFLIALENLQLKATKYIHYLADWQCYYGTIDLLAQPTVKIYVPNRIRPMLTITPSDSIFWEEYGNTPAYVENHMIKEEQMLKEASEFAGTIPVKHLPIGLRQHASFMPTALYICEMPSYTSVRIHGTKLSISGNKPLKQAKVTGRRCMQRTTSPFIMR